RLNSNRRVCRWRRQCRGSQHPLHGGCRHDNRNDASVGPGQARSFREGAQYWSTRRRGEMSSSSLSSGRESMEGSSPSTCSSTGPDGFSSCGAAPGGNSRSPLRPQAASAVASTRPSRSSFVPCIFIGSFLPLPHFTEHFAPAGCCRAHIVRCGATEACPARDRIVHAEHGIYLIRDTGLHLAHFLDRKSTRLN